MKFGRIGVAVLVGSAVFLSQTAVSSAMVPEANLQKGSGIVQPTEILGTKQIESIGISPLGNASGSIVESFGSIPPEQTFGDKTLNLVPPAQQTLGSKSGNSSIGKAPQTPTLTTKKIVKESGLSAKPVKKSQTKAKKSVTFKRVYVQRGFLP